MILFLGLLGTGWVAVRATARLAAETEAGNRKRLSHEATLHRALQRRAFALDQRAILERELASLQPGSGVQISKKPELPPRIPTIAERLRTEPDAQVLWLNAKHAQARATYGPLFRKLGLTQDQIAKFEENLTRKEERELDFQAMTAEQLKSVGKITAELNAARQNNDVEYKAAQRALLGEVGYRELEEQQRTAWVRQLVDGWAGGATVILKEPLTVEQGEALIQIIASASESYGQGKSAATPIDWSAVDSAAQRILTPNQFKLLTTMEPPPPNGGRFQSQLYEKIGNAAATETKPHPQ